MSLILSDKSWMDKEKASLTANMESDSAIVDDGEKTSLERRGKPSDSRRLAVDSVVRLRGQYYDLVTILNKKISAIYGYIQAN
jgi:hypothetical protein